jgi:hypothetical protein
VDTEGVMDHKSLLKKRKYGLIGKYLFLDKKK